MAQKQKKMSIDFLNKIADLVQWYSPNDSKQFYQKFFENVGKILLFEHATIFYLDEESQKLIEIASTGKTVDLIHEIAFKYGYGLSGWNAKKKKILLLNDIDTNNNDRDISIRSFLSLPLVIEKKLIGIMNFSHSLCQAFHKDEVSDIAFITPLLAAIISKNVIIKDLNKRIEELERQNHSLQKKVAMHE